MAVKAVCFIDDVFWEGTDTLTAQVRYVSMESSVRQERFLVTGVSVALAGATAIANLKQAVKDELGIGVLDTVWFVGDIV